MGCVNRDRKVPINCNSLYFFFRFIAALYHIFAAFSLWDQLWDQLYREKKILKYFFSLVVQFFYQMGPTLVQH